MILRLDTGFFIQYGEGNARAINIWNQALVGAHDLVVSTLTVAELYNYYYPRAKADVASTTVALMQELSNITLAPVSVQIATNSARYRAGIGLATVDSIILATFLESGCQLALTTDSDFTIANDRNILAVEIL